jgi:hypothetical protein
VGTASITQFRVLGGLIGLAIAASLTTPYLREHLAANLPHDLTARVLYQTKYIAMLPEREQKIVRTTFGESFGLQMRLVIALAVAQLPGTALMWTTQVIDTKT